MAEVRHGDPNLAVRRLDSLRSIDVLEVTASALELAREIVGASVIPAKVLEDAIHVATATVHGIDYLVTWNCRHIANAEIELRLLRLCQGLGYKVPILCTPEQLMGK